MLLRSLTLVWLLTATAFSPAQDDNRKHLARFFNDQSLLVGRIDLQRMDVEATLDLLLGLKLPMHEELQKGKAKLSTVKAALLKAGAHRLFLIYNQGDLFQMPAIYVPLEDTAQAETVASLVAHLHPGPFPQRPSWLAPRSQATWKVVDNYVLVGSASSLQTLTTSKPAVRPAFTAALVALKDAPVQLLMLPTADLRKVMTEMMPQFPKELGQGSTTSIVNGVQWASITAGLPPQLQAQLTVQTDQPSQAAELQQLWQKLLISFKKETDASSANWLAKGLFQLVNSMEVTVKGNQVVMDANAERLRGVTQLLSQNLSVSMSDELNASKLRNIVVAMHNYHGDWQRLPNQCIMSKDGKPLLSWRVALLPYVEGDLLYKQFKLDEPWDSEHNKKLISRMPEVYIHPFAKNVPANHTLYQVFYSKKGAKPAAMFAEEGRISLNMVTLQDGVSNTFIVTDASPEAVPWTKPVDLLYDGTVANLPKLVSPRNNGWAHVCFGDGSVRRFKPGGSPKLLWQLIGRNDGMSFDASELFSDK